MSVSLNIYSRPKALPIGNGAKKDEPGVYVERFKNQTAQLRIITRNGKETVGPRTWDVEDEIAKGREKAIEMGLRLFYRHAR